MKNVSDKIKTLRVARAESIITMAPESVKRLLENDVPKKDVLAIARVAGIMAAKNTPVLIPYCHGISLDCATIDFECGENRIKVTAEVTAIWKTGVEMEALAAASVATLTIYDMIKAIDKNMEIVSTRLVEKTGGKTDYVETIPKNFSAAVIVTSDGTFQKQREDKSGKIISKKLEEMGIHEIEYVILPDEVNLIEQKMRELCDKGVRLIVSTGGTGLGPRDVTVEATAKVIERDMPAVMQALHGYGQERTPYAMLSRGLAGVRGKTVIVNLPGSSRGAEEGMNAVFPALLHVYKMMRGDGHEEKKHG